MCVNIVAHSNHMVGAGRQAIVAGCEILCIPARAGASRGRKCCRDWQGHCALEWASPRWQGAPRTQTESLDPGEKGWLGMVLQASPSSTPTTTVPSHLHPPLEAVRAEENTTRPLNSAAPFHCAHKNTHIFMSVLERRRVGRGLKAAQSVCEPSRVCAICGNGSVNSATNVTIVPSGFFFITSWGLFLVCFYPSCIKTKWCD